VSLVRLNHTQLKPMLEGFDSSPSTRALGTHDPSALVVFSVFIPVCVFTNIQRDMLHSTGKSAL